METLFFFLIQLVVQSLIGLVWLTFAVAVLLGRILAMLLPVLCRAVAILVMSLFRVLLSHRRPEASRPWQEVLPPPHSDVDGPRSFLRRKPPTTPPRYSRRYTVRNVRRWGDR